MTSSDPTRADSAAPSSPPPIVGDDNRSIPGPGDSAPRKLRKRERTWIILLLLVVGLVLIELFDRYVGIPNR